MTLKDKPPTGATRARNGNALRSGPLPAVQPITLDSTVDRVSRELRLAVLAGRLRPGETFSITQLCSELGVSHIPVREALRRLEGQGLVELRHGRSGVVTQLSVGDLDEIYHLRTLIETDLIKKSATLLSDEEVANLSDSLEEMESTSGDPQSDAFWAAHHEFHWQLLEPAAHAWAERILLPLWHATERYTRLFYTDAPQINMAMAEHRALLSAAERRSSKELSSLLRDHLRQSHATLRTAASQLETIHTN